MKTKVITRVIRYLFIALLFLSWISGLYSQQIIQFKNRKMESVVIEYQNKDIVKYHLPSDSLKTCVVLMDKVESIFPINPAVDMELFLQYDRKYLHYKHVSTFGIVLGSGGALLAIAGGVTMGNAEHTNNEFWGDTYDAQMGLGAVVTGIGGVMLLTGAILVITQSAKMEAYKKKMRGFSFNVKYTTALKGISFTYKF
jgi:hypothetical protein